MSTESATVRVMHIGTRERRADTMSGEGTVWHGHGDVKTVSRKAWETHLRRYPDLWVLAPEEAPAPAAPVSGGLASVSAGGADDKAKAGAEGGADSTSTSTSTEGQQPATNTGSAPEYSALERAEVIKLARERGLQFDGRASKEQVIELLLADDKAKAGA